MSEFTMPTEYYDLWRRVDRAEAILDRHTDCSPYLTFEIVDDEDTEVCPLCAALIELRAGSALPLNPEREAVSVRGKGGRPGVGPSDSPPSLVGSEPEGAVSEPDAGASVLGDSSPNEEKESSEC